ncbi:DUF4174 domain-containing protein [Sphingomonas qomolangmaensis]|uniref:DUF4174 domain-containing protein n=1 Tax=Sphingomonas qomolangmaensis TaxID=2918765 RepID=A0ABY5LBT1_9SPHN|nr:DUF4174 domain-containing protein [Sphingomonas qomolangmaensis]UUL83556.1 DUF4174 domain-containing protein [Sphingomonas qomolangmaensis]
MIEALLPLGIAAAVQAAPASLYSLQWERRVLIVFAPSRDDPDLASQRRLLDKNAMAERDLHVIEVIGDSVSGVRDYAGRLRQRYGVSEREFQAVLLGKDGGLKLRRTDPIAMSLLSDTIDAMPMRRAEAARISR